MLAALEREQNLRASRNKLTEYIPYPKQIEFHSALYRERLLVAANRFGKTQSGAFELAIHLTGRYPEWWQGRRFDLPIRAWAAGITGESTRDVVQAKLLGPPDRKEAWGTGTIPKDALGEILPGRGIANGVDMVSIKHVSGGWSSLAFKTYEKGREKWQGTALEVVWFDEEPPLDIYTEGLTRTGETKGIVYITCTPLLGMSDVMQKFLMSPTTESKFIQATLADAGHFSEADREMMIRGWPKHERDARARGIPTLGSGRVYPIDEDEIKCEPFQIPSHWVWLGGLDFGWDHPSAAVKIAWDRDSDCIYVTAAHRMREQTPAMFSASVKPWGHWLPWAWPHDGLQHDKGSGEQLAAQYRVQGLQMLPQRATFEDGSNGLEAGIADLFDRMQTGRLKVFSHLKDWFEEFNLYHRKEGLIVKKGEDLLSATRYAVMMRRFAIVQNKPAPKPELSRVNLRPTGWMS